MSPRRVRHQREATCQAAEVFAWRGELKLRSTEDSA
jgi:hypothetical protein